MPNCNVFHLLNSANGGFFTVNASPANLSNSRHPDLGLRCFLANVAISDRYLTRHKSKAIFPKESKSKVFTALGTFKLQKKSRKRGNKLYKFTFDELHADKTLEDAIPAKKVKGFVHIDKKWSLTTLFIDTNGNGKLDKGRKDLLIGAYGDYEKSFYKSKRGKLHATNNEESISEALSNLFGGPPPEECDCIYNTGIIFTDKRGKTLDFIPLSEQGDNIDVDGLRSIVCSMKPVYTQENAGNFQSLKNDCGILGIDIA